jgi:hypothetical protein
MLPVQLAHNLRTPKLIEACEFLSQRNFLHVWTVASVTRDVTLFAHKMCRARVNGAVTKVSGKQTSETPH